MENATQNGNILCCFGKFQLLICYNFNSELGGKLNLLNGAVIRLGRKEQGNGTTYGALRLVEFNFGSDTDHNMITLDLINGHVDRHDFGKVTQNASVNHLLDVDIKWGGWWDCLESLALNVTTCFASKNFIFFAKALRTLLAPRSNPKVASHPHHLIKKHPFGCFKNGAGGGIRTHA